MDYMQHALSLARLALGNTSPNPAVGAVIVRDGVVAGQGYTQPPGCDHAEVVALREAGEKAQGATMYVTLEPCCHFGRTPPCSQAIIAAGIAEVHLATLDPNPQVSGRGKKELEEAGIKTYLGEHEQEARQLNEAYIKFIETGLPFVIAKFAMSLDGKTATRMGDSRWISGEESREYVHCLRQTVDAIVVGVNTVLADDPQLTARGKDGVKGMRKVIVDCLGRTPPAAQAFRAPGKVLLAVGQSIEPERAKEFENAGAELLELPSRDGFVDLKGLLRGLGEREVTSVLVEGGGTLLGSFFDLGLVDKVYAFIAPIIIGGKDAVPAVGGEGIDEVKRALRLSRVSVERFGEDVMICGYPSS